MLDICMEDRQRISVSGDDYNEAVTLTQNIKLEKTISVSHLSFQKSSASNPIFKILFVSFGYTLSTLELINCTVDPHGLREIIFNKAPNLESIKLEDIVYENGRGPIFINPESRAIRFPFCLPNLRSLELSEFSDGVVTTSIANIVRCCPNLIKMKFIGCFLDQEEAIIASAYVEKLRILSLGPNESNIFNEHFINALIKLRVNLKKVCLKGLQLLTSRNETTMSPLQEFLHSTSRSLEDLSLFHKCDYVNCMHDYTSILCLTFPALNNLNVDNAFLIHTEALPGMRALTNLICTKGSLSEKLNRNFRTILPKMNHTLTRLQLGLIEPMYLKKLGYASPNVMSLSVCAMKNHDVIFRVICSTFPKLRRLFFDSLGLKTDGLTDAGVTGVPEEDFKLILSGQNANNLRRFSYVGELKHLQCLWLEKCTGLTDTAVLYGISYLSAIDCISLAYSQISDVSVFSLTFHCRKLQTLDLTGCRWVTASTLELAKQKLKNLNIYDQGVMSNDTATMSFCNQ